MRVQHLAHVAQHFLLPLIQGKQTTATTEAIVMPALTSCLEASMPAAAMRYIFSYRRFDRSNGKKSLMSVKQRRAFVCVRVASKVQLSARSRLAFDESREMREASVEVDGFEQLHTNFKAACVRLKRNAISEDVRLCKN